MCISPVPSESAGYAVLSSWIGKYWLAADSLDINSAWISWTGKSLIKKLHFNHIPRSCDILTELWQLVSKWKRCMTLMGTQQWFSIIPKCITRKCPVGISPLIQKTLSNQCPSIRLKTIILLIQSRSLGAVSCNPYPRINLHPLCEAN